MNRIKRFFHGLFSMRTAIITLLLLIAACILGSVIPQGQTEAYYTETYAGSLHHLILLIGANDVFHQWWFFVLTAFLCLNLLGCNLLRFPALHKQQVTSFTLDQRLKTWDENDAITAKDPSSLFASLGFQHTETKEHEGKETIYAVRNKIGLWGAWLTHLGLLVVIIGFTLGQTMKTEYSVYGVPGEAAQVGDTSYVLIIEDFWIDKTEDDSVEQYTSRLTMKDSVSGKQSSGETSVNHPLKLFGMKLYQNSYGWAATVDVLKNGQPIQLGVLCAGEYFEISDKPGLFVMLNNVYPELSYNENGMPVTVSNNPVNPGYLYTIYYNGNVVGMNVLAEGDEIHIDEYTILIHDPQNYTLIQVKRDPFTGVTLVGGLILLLALFVSFYLRTEEVWAVKQEDGTYRIGARSVKGGDLFLEKVKERISEEGGKE